MLYRVFGETCSPSDAVISYGVYDRELAKLLEPLVMNVYDLTSVEGHICIDEGVVSITRLLADVDQRKRYSINRWAELGYEGRNGDQQFEDNQKALNKGNIIAAFTGILRTPFPTEEAIRLITAAFEENRVLCDVRLDAADERYEFPASIAYLETKKRVDAETADSIRKKKEEKASAIPQKWSALNDRAVVEYKDRVFVLTGFEENDEQKLVSFIKSKGGIIKSSVVLATNYLIVNTAYTGEETTKYKRAVELIGKGKDIRIISGDKMLPEFRRKPPSSKKSVSQKYVTPENQFTVSGTTLLSYDWYGKRIVIPDYITAIGKNAFSERDITHITIPASVEQIDETAFERCSFLEKISVSRYNKAYITIDGVLYTKDGKTLLKYPAKKSESSFEAPSYVTRIANNAFEMANNLKKVQLPEGIFEIGKYAFFGCRKLETINIPKGLAVIPEGCFLACEKLQGLTLPECIHDIKPYAFENCQSISQINIPSGVSSIEDTMLYGNTSLERIVVSEENRQYSSVDDVLYSKDGKTLIKYPPKKDGNKFVVPPHVSTIYEKAFENCANLKELWMSDDVTSIGSEAFMACTSLEKLYISHAITLDTNGLFRKCEKLTDIVYQDKISEAVSGTFSECVNPRRMVIPNGVSYLRSSFYDCKSLSEIIIPPSVNEIDESTFTGCINLQRIEVAPENESFTAIDNVLYSKDGKKLIRYAPQKPDKTFTIPDHVKEIGKYAFDNCNHLKEVTIADNVSDVGSFAFYKCKNLHKATIAPNVTGIGTHAFGKCENLKKVFIMRTSYTHINSIFPCELVLGQRLDMIFSESPSVVFYVQREASLDLIECLLTYNFKIQYIEDDKI